MSPVIRGMELNHPKAGGVLLVARDWGQVEDEFKRPLIGPAGQLFEEVLIYGGWRREDVNLTNVVPESRPWDDEFHAHKPETVAAGRQALDEWVKKLKPSLIITMGNEAAYHFVPDWPTQGRDIYGAKGIEDRAGYFWETKYGTVFTVLHPSAALHKMVPGFELLRRHFQRARRWAKGYLPRTEFPEYLTLRSQSEAQGLLANKVLASDIETRFGKQIFCVGFTGDDFQPYVAKYGQGFGLMRQVLNGRKGLVGVFHNGMYDVDLLDRNDFPTTLYTDDTQAMWGNGLEPELAFRDEGEHGGRLTRKGLSSLATLCPDLNCVASGQRVLTADLRWVPIETVRVGDKLIAFDEEPTKEQSRTAERRLIGKQKHRGFRRWRVTTVLAVRSARRECVKISSNAGSLVVTDDHPILTAQGNRQSPRGRAGHIKYWRMPRQFTDKTKACFTIAPWDDPTDYESGWFGGFLDGEGCLAERDVSFSQVPGIEAERANAYLTANGFAFRSKIVRQSRTPHNPIQHTMVTGGILEQMRILGMARPKRLVRKFASRIAGLKFCAGGVLISQQKAGTRTVVDLTTTTGTFIAEGFAVHNCPYWKSNWHRHGFPEWSAGYPPETTDDLIELSKLYTMAARDTFVTRKLYTWLRKEVDKQERDFQYRLAFETNLRCITMTRRGWSVDEPLRVERMTLLKQKADVLGEESAKAALKYIEEHDIEFFKKTLECKCCSGVGERCWRCAGLAISPKRKADYLGMRLGAADGKLPSIDESDLGTYTVAELKIMMAPCKTCEGRGKNSHFEFNAFSPAQLKELIYGVIKAPKWTFRGKDKMDEMALIKLLAWASEGPSGKESV